MRYAKGLESICEFVADSCRSLACCSVNAPYCKVDKGEEVTEEKSTFIQDMRSDAVTHYRKVFHGTVCTGKRGTTHMTKTEERESNTEATEPRITTTQRTPVQQ